MTDSRVATIVQSNEGDIAFQTYFVALGCEPEVKGFRFEGIESAKPAKGVLEVLADADLVVICPSNPWVSIDPILAVAGIANAIRLKSVVGISPIIGGRTVKGPAAKMYQEMGVEPSAVSVAKHYQTLLKGFVLDQADLELESGVQELGMQVCVTQTVMQDLHDRKMLAEAVLEFALQL